MSSSYNPYLPPSDDDIFNPTESQAQTKHTYNGEPCPECEGVIHDIVMDDDIPTEVQEELDHILDSLPKDEKGAKLIVTSPDSPAGLLLQEIQDFFTGFDDVVPIGPTLRACVEMLNRITYGELNTLIAMYTAEQRLMIYIDQLRMLNKFVGQIDGWLEEYERKESLITLKKILADIQTTTLGKLEEVIKPEYCKACADAEAEPSQELLDGDLSIMPTDAGRKLMFYYISSTLVREYLKRDTEEASETVSDNATQITEERTQPSVSTDPLKRNQEG